MSSESALRDGNRADFELIETMRWEPGSGFLRFDRHLARLYASAAQLGFACDPQRVGEALTGAVGGRQIALRTRLALQRNGEVTASAQSYEPLPVGQDGIYRSEVLPGLWLDPDALIRGDLLTVFQVVQQGLASPEHAAFVRRLEQTAARGQP